MSSHRAPRLIGSAALPVPTSPKSTRADRMYSTLVSEPYNGALVIFVVYQVNRASGNLDAMYVAPCIMLTKAWIY